MMKMDTDRLVEYNPELSQINPMARIAYARFKMALIKQEYTGLQESRQSISSERRGSKGKFTQITKTTLNIQSNHLLPKLNYTFSDHKRKKQANLFLKNPKIFEQMTSFRYDINIEWIF